MFKKGDKVRCIIDQSPLISKNKVYHVRSACPTFVVLMKDDTNRDGASYGNECFELIEEPKTEPFQFRAGDRVKIEGVLCNNDMPGSDKYPFVLATPGDDRQATFTIDGSMFIGEKTILQLVERPKKKVKKTVERWAIITDSSSLVVYMDQKDAERYAKDRGYSVVKLTGEYEVEEE